MSSNLSLRGVVTAIGFMGLVAASTSSFAADPADIKQESFRFAVPEHYVLVEHSVEPALQGGSVLFAPDSGQDAQARILHLQTYLSKYYPEQLAAMVPGQPREFLNLVLDTELKQTCSDYTLDSGKIRQRNGGTRINWWTSCQLKSDPGQYRFERGRMFLAESGGYFISHINLSQNKDHKFNRQEIHWFDKYLYNSGLCVKGADCGDEGALVSELFTEK